MARIGTGIRPLGWGGSIAIFGFFSLLLILETRYLIPFLSRVAGIEIVVSWFIVAAFGTFIPLLFLAIFLLRPEGQPWSRTLWQQRLRFKALTASDLKWTLAGFIGIMLGSLLIIQILSLFFGTFHSQPPFMTFDVLGPGRYWILAIWFPYWLFNIMGEEILWRGVLLPRQEIKFGKYTWIIHGFCWGLFHIAFGWKLLVTLLPILFIQSFIVQKTQNTWTGVILHAGINGPSFIAISLGAL